MKLRNLFTCAVASAMAFMACQPEDVDLGAPSIALSESEVIIAKEGGDATLTVTSTRDWTVTIDEETAKWLAVDPAAGKASAEAQTVTVTALENDGFSREASLAFTIGMQTKYLTVKQDGNMGSSESLLIYSNDFDVTKAQKGDKGWPFLDSSNDIWDNKKGSGSETVQYEFGGKMSVRTSGKLSNDGSGFSHYAGSGSNKIFFGTATSIFKIQNITLNPETVSYKLSFGGQKYGQEEASNVFTFDEFKVYLSNDSQKWTPVTVTFPEDADLDGDWNLASGSFTVPQGTTTLGIAFVCTKSSVYSIDDVLLEVGTEAGQTIDFSAGSTIDGTAGGNNDGGSTTTPTNITDVTVAEFNNKPVSTTEWYRLSGTVGGPINTQYGNYYLIDATGKVYVYGTSNWSQYSSKFVEGAKVTIVGQRGDYNGKIEVLESYIESFNGEGGNTDGGGTQDPTPDTGAPEIPASFTSVRDFIAAPVGDTWYKVKGQIVNIEKETYGNFTIKDDAGDELYVYGLTKEYKASNDQSFSSIGLKAGYYVTFVAKRGEYNNNPQAVGAFYVSHEVGELDLGEDVSFTKLTAAPADWTGSYLIYMADKKVHAAVSGKDLTAVSEVLSDNAGVIVAPEAYAVQVESAGNGKWAIKLPSGKYLGPAHNSCSSSNTPVALGMEWTAAGVKISGEATKDGNTNTYYLYYSTNNGEYIRFYVDKSSDERYTLPTLYKK